MVESICDKELPELREGRKKKFLFLLFPLMIYCNLLFVKFNNLLYPDLLCCFVTANDQKAGHDGGVSDIGTAIDDVIVGAGFCQTLDDKAGVNEYVEPVDVIARPGHRRPRTRVIVPEFAGLQVIHSASQSVDRAGIVGDEQDRDKLSSGYWVLDSYLLK